MIQVGPVEAQPQLLPEMVEGVEQGQRVGAAGDGHDDGPAAPARAMASLTRRCSLAVTAAPSVLWDGMTVCCEGVLRGG